MACSGEKRIEKHRVSVVVPMYNVEKYIEKCINSLLNQTLSDLEIILVDDGSPDKAGAIAEAYASKYEHVKVIHQKNAGLGPARNSGIQASTGEYVGFVDGDDWVRPSMFRSLYEAGASYGADIVCGGHCTYCDEMVSGEFIHPLAGVYLNEFFEIQKMRKNLYGHKPGDKETASFPVTVWTNIYKREFITNNRIIFSDLLSEDTIFNLNAFAKAKSILFTNDADYCYRKDGQSSITNSFSPRALQRSEQFIYALDTLARGEADSDTDECQMRVNYAAVEYSRLYIALVLRSNLSVSKKVDELRKLVNSRMFTDYANEFPIRQLQPYQRMCQFALSHGYLKPAMLLVYFREMLK